MTSVGGASLGWSWWVIGRGRFYGCRTWSGRPGRLPAPAPLRSGRARLTHPAPRAMNSLRDQTDAPQPSRGQRETPLQLAEALPRDPRLVRAAAEPLLPGPPHVVQQAVDPRHIADDGVIRVVPAKLARQGEPLLPDRQVPVLAAPAHHRLHGSVEPILGRPTLHRPAAPERPTPVVGETQEVERAGATLWRGAQAGPLEAYQPGLLRMEGQAVLRESLREYVQDPSRVALRPEDQDRVVGITDQGRPPLQAGFDRPLEPCVQDLVEVGVGQEG